MTWSRFRPDTWTDPTWTPGTTRFEVALKAATATAVSKTRVAIVPTANAAAKRIARPPRRLFGSAGTTGSRSSSFGLGASDTVALAGELAVDTVALASELAGDTVALAGELAGDTAALAGELASDTAALAGGTTSRFEDSHFLASGTAGRPAALPGVRPGTSSTRSVSSVAISVPPPRQFTTAKST